MRCGMISKKQSQFAIIYFAMPAFISLKCSTFQYLHPTNYNMQFSNNMFGHITVKMHIKGC